MPVTYSYSGNRDWEDSGSGQVQAKSLVRPTSINKLAWWHAPVIPATPKHKKQLGLKDRLPAQQVQVPEFQVLVSPKK
jgi:hypothetical protein